MVESASPYFNHVSFQDLSPDLVDRQVARMRKQSLQLEYSSPFIHIPPQFNPLYVDASEKHINDSCGSSARKKVHLNLGLGYMSASEQQVPEAYKYTFDNTNKQGARRSIYPSPSPSRSISDTCSNNNGKLPPPPKITILKAKRPEQEIAEFDISKIDTRIEHEIETITRSNTGDNASSHKGYTTAGFSNLHELEDRLLKKTTPKEKVAVSKDPLFSKPRRKSYAEMTNEELEELEKSMVARNTHDLDQFDFSQQNKLFIGEEPSKGSQKQRPDTMVITSLYPTRSSVSYNAVSCTKVHEDYVKLLNAHAKSASDDALRTVMCFISGRQHTWSSVDWYVHQLARDGDHLVIMASLPDYEEQISTSAKAHKPSISSLQHYQLGTGQSGAVAQSVKNESFADDERIAFSVLEVDGLAMEKCLAIREYYANICKDKILKITVEFVKHSSRTTSIARAISVFKPDLQLISTVSTNLTARLRNAHVKLPNFIVRHLPVPTAIVANEFIRPVHLAARRNTNDNTPICTQIQRLDQLIETTFKPHFLQPSCQTVKSSGFDTYTDTPPASRDSASIVDYFPGNKQTKPNREQFETLGYIPPCPTYFNSKGSLSTSSRSSRRSSRVNFSGPEIYKVKSLLSNIKFDDDEEDSTPEFVQPVNNQARKRPLQVASNSGSRQGLPVQHALSRKSSVKSESYVPPPKNKHKISGFLKKLGLK